MQYTGPLPVEYPRRGEPTITKPPERGKESPIPQPFMGGADRGRRWREDVWSEGSTSGSMTSGYVTEDPALDQPEVEQSEMTVPLSIRRRRRMTTTVLAPLGTGEEG